MIESASLENIDADLFFSTEREEFRVEAPIIVHVYERGQYRNLIVPIGFWSDLASIPRILQARFSKIGRHVVPAIVHDYIYRTEGVRILKHEADKIFLELMEQCGVRFDTRWLMYLGVKFFGGSSWRASSKLKF